MHTAIVVFATMLVIAAIATFNARRQPSAPNRITPGKVSAAIVVVAGVCMALLGFIGIAVLFMHAEQDGFGVWIGLLVTGALLVGFMAPSLTHAHDVTWESDYVEGPAHMFGLTLGWKRHRVDWRDIVKTGKTLTGYDYLETHDGRRIYWSYLYPGFGRFEHALRSRSNFR
ncbi:hypothetical protein MTR66_19025 [Novosphingobium sp. 2638]|uniref:PH domain-containing protein n=2 Tax=Novosphingobium beihaiensis TaxID=2930389 RepID=A0ABT0BV38_9SPHN|nr:hypothetical protein [Novosphingobium beihaiensis]